MPELPGALYSAAQARELDRIAIERSRIPAMTLMERAGQAVWKCFAELWPGARSVTVVCGGGNNGGDGYVFARLAHEQGTSVDLVGVVPPQKLKGEAKAAADRFQATGLKVSGLGSDGARRADVIVDALLGTGLDRQVEQEYLQAIGSINAGNKPVLSIDIPSGLHADTGRVMGAAVSASATITLIGLKLGLFTGSGPDHAGRILFSHLDVPEEVYSAVPPAARRIDHDLLKHHLGRRRPTVHKGEFGHVLVVGGDYGFPGAARLAGEAAARVGSGLVSIATRPEHAALIPVARPELMARGIAAPSDLAPLLERATVVAAGPGLGQSPWGAALFARLLETKLPMVIDADALRLLAREPARSDSWVLTPHPGEAAALLGTDADTIQSDRFHAVRELRARFGGVAVLKGAGSLIAAPGGVTLCSGGNPGMASGGMGDVLTGVIAGLLAQGFGQELGVQLGVCLHAAAADRAAQDGARGLLAADLMPWLRRLANPSE